MITYFIYALIFIILVYVLYLAVKAIGRGIDAKQNLDKDESNFNDLNDQKDYNNPITILSETV